MGAGGGRGGGWEGIGEEEERGRKRGKITGEKMNEVQHMWSFLCPKCYQVEKKNTSFCLKFDWSSSSRTC